MYFHIAVRIIFQIYQFTEFISVFFSYIYLFTYPKH